MTMLDCPTKARMAIPPSAWLLFQSYRWFKEGGVLPSPGGFLDQSAVFVSTCDFIDSYISASRKFIEATAERFKNGRKRKQH